MSCPIHQKSSLVPVENNVLREHDPVQLYPIRACNFILYTQTAATAELSISIVLSSYQSYTNIDGYLSLVSSLRLSGLPFLCKSQAIMHRL